MQELTSGTPSANIVAGLGLDGWFARTDGSGTSYFLGDALGSTMALADGTGAVQTAYTYEPFGEFSTSGAGTSNPSGFTGREADGTGLSFCRARYYHPQLQRSRARIHSDSAEPKPPGFDEWRRTKHGGRSRSRVVSVGAYTGEDLKLQIEFGVHLKSASREECCCAAFAIHGGI